MSARRSFLAAAVLKTSCTRVPGIAKKLAPQSYTHLCILKLRAACDAPPAASTTLLQAHEKTDKEVFFLATGLNQDYHATSSPGIDNSTLWQAQRWPCARTRACWRPWKLPRRGTRCWRKLLRQPPTTACPWPAAAACSLWTPPQTSSSCTPSRSGLLPHPPGIHLCVCSFIERTMQKSTRRNT